jgi:hypothetical protein
VIYGLYIEINPLTILDTIIHQVSQKTIEDSVFSLVRPAWSLYPDSHASSRISHVVQVNGDDSDKREYHGLPGLGVGLTTPPLKAVIVEKVLATGRKYI